MTEKIRWNSLDKIIIEKLCIDSELSSYFVYANLGFSPISIAESVAKLDEAGLASRRGDVITRSATFHERLFSLRHRIYNRPMPWKESLATAEAKQLKNDGRSAS